MNKAMKIISEIKNLPEYKRILADSFGGVMYNTANQNKYKTEEILKLWNELSDPEKGPVDGIMVGAINFIKGE